MKSKNHLPVFGVGPVCIYLMLGLTAAGIALLWTGHLSSGAVPVLRIPFLILGAVLILLGIFMWCKAVISAKISREIVANHLVTTGIYAWVRNPIYSAFALFLTGVCLLFANLWLLVLPPIFWLIITGIMRCTEEKWLLERYGEVYQSYCARVNRCIPWFPRR